MLRRLVASSLLLLWGCSSEEEGNAEPCNTLRNNGPKVMAVVAEGDAPTPVPMGGEIADGTYVLIGISYYGEAAALPSTEIQSVFEISGNKMQQVGSIDDEETRYNSTFSTSGTTVTLRDTCPAPMTSRFEFTATADQFYIYDDRAGGIMEQFFELRD